MKNAVVGGKMSSWLNQLRPSSIFVSNYEHVFSIWWLCVCSVKSKESFFFSFHGHNVWSEVLINQQPRCQENKQTVFPSTPVKRYFTLVEHVYALAQIQSQPLKSAVLENSSSHYKCHLFTAKLLSSPTTPLVCFGLKVKTFHQAVKYRFNRISGWKCLNILGS